MIVILTALEVEYLAVRGQLAGPRPHRHAAGTRFELGEVAGRPVALGLTGAGNATAAIIAERAVTEFSPEMVVFVGVAGGLRDWLKIGDIVVATRVYGYHGERSEDDGSRIRPRAYETAHEPLETARVLARSASWRAGLATDPAVHFEPIASGEVVLNSRTSPTARRLDQNFNDAVAVETEGAGVAQCGHLQGGLPTVTIRGISDHADGHKDSDDKTGSQRLAAQHAALFARALIGSLDDIGGPRVREPKARTAVTVVTNTVNGKSNNSMQIGTVNGGMHFGPKPDAGDRP